MYFINNDKAMSPGEDYFQPIMLKSHISWMGMDGNPLLTVIKWMLMIIDLIL